jgi:cytosine/adenosine deaminase-related metal-dependent hydrolase
MSITPGTLLIKGARVYDHDGDVHQPAVADILIENRRIAAVGSDLGVPDAATEIIHATGKLAIPGFVNAHYHSHDVLAKGMFEDLPLEIWSLYAGPMGANRGREEVRLRTQLGALECLRNGITTVQDMLNLTPMREDYLDTVLEAYADVGIRVVCGIATRDIAPVDTLPFLRQRLPPAVQAIVGTGAGDGYEQIDFIKAQLSRRPSGTSRLHWAVSPSAPQRCTATLLEALSALSRRYDLPVYTHVYESKFQALHARLNYADRDGSFVQLLDDTGLLDRRLTVAHGVWLGEAEIERLADRDVGIALNIMSNFKSKSGIAPISGLRRAGVRLALGCDNCSCSDVQNMFQAMKLFCFLSSVGDPESSEALAADALRVATEGGARTAGLAGEIGALRPGMKADLVLLDLNDPAFVPLNSVARQLVYSETGRAIETVVVDGRVVMRDRKILTVDESALRAELTPAMKTFREDYTRLEEMNRAALPHMRAVYSEALSHDIGLWRHGGR